MAADLNNRHRDTVERIFSHPSSGNVEWRQVLSLLETIGTTTEEHNGKVKVTLGPETEILQPPRGKDVDQQTIVDLRRMLTQAGFAPRKVPATEEGRHRKKIAVDIESAGFVIFGEERYGLAWDLDGGLRRWRISDSA